MKKWYFVQITAIVLIAVICLGKNIQKNKLYDQNANTRWGKSLAQLSVFYPMEEKPSDYFYFQDLSHRVEKELENSAVADDLVVDGESGLSFPWSVCASGRITVSSDKGDVELETIGVSEDFFVFHPVELLYGSYIQADDLMTDGILIDEDAAWKLFGANDVVGMTVTVSGVPHYIKGVVRKSDDRFSEKAGLEKSMCYVSLNTLSEYGTIYGSYDYELIVQNPVDDFGIGILRTALGQSGEKLQIIENSTRFENSQIQNILINFGVRSMSSAGIIYPYFENVARAWEDAFALLLFIEYVLFILIVIILIVHIRILYRSGKLHKPHPISWVIRVVKEFKRNEIYSNKNERKRKAREKRKNFGKKQKNNEMSEVVEIDDLEKALKEGTI